MKNVVKKIAVPFLSIVFSLVCAWIAMDTSVNGAYATGENLVSVTGLFENPCKAHIYGGALCAVLCVMDAVYMILAFSKKPKRMGWIQIIFLPLAVILDIVVSCFPCCKGAVAFIIMNWLFTVLLAVMFYCCEKEFILGLFRKKKKAVHEEVPCAEENKEEPSDKPEEKPVPEKQEEEPKKNEK